MTSGEHTEQENDSKRAGRRQRGGEGGEERKKNNFNEGINDRDAREGRPPGMTEHRQGPRHRMAMGLDVSTERSRDRWRCSVVVRACREEGTTRQKAQRKKTRTTPHSATGGRAAQSERAAGERDGAKRADEGPRVAQKKNHTCEEQYQQRRVTTWGKGKGNGGRGGQEEGPTSGPEGNTPRKRKGAGRGRPVLGSRTGLGRQRTRWARARGLQAAQKKKRDAEERGRDRKGRVARATRRPQGTRTAWEAAQE